jgi:hypothetical protein
VVGLDLSLTGPAACCIPPGWEIGDWSALDVEAWMPEVPAKDDLAGLYRRLSWIVDRVVAFVARASLPDRWVGGPYGAGGRPAVAVEAYAFAARSSSVTKLAELGGAVRVALYSRGIIAVPVTASEARKLVLGKLPRKDQKTAVQAALWAAGCPKEWSGDVLDSFAVANAARSNLGGIALTLA